MTDREIVSALIAHDPKVTAQFLFKDCRLLFLSVIKRVFWNQIVDYDEIISELYILLMENDARRLRQFTFKSTLYQWLKTVAIRHCLKLKFQAKVIENDSKASISIDKDCKNFYIMENSYARMDLEALLGQVKNQRYVMVIRLLMLDGLSPEDVAKRLSIHIDNLYNIKRRAILALAKVALKDIKHYE